MKLKNLWIGLLTGVLAFSAGVLAFSAAGCGKQAEAPAQAPVEETQEAGMTAEAADRPENETDGSESGTVQQPEADKTAVRVGSMKGPTSMGLVELMEKAKSGETVNEYTFSMETSADTLLPMLIKGELDIALVPANVASVLWNKTDGGVYVIDINTLGVLYLVSGDDSVSGLSDLKGRTVYLIGKGTTPDYVLQYLLRESGLSEDVTLEYKSEAAEVAALLAENPDGIGLLPEPFVTAACAKNEKLKAVLDLNKEWDALQETNKSGGRLVTGVTVVRKGFLMENGQAVLAFMQEQKASVEAVNADPAGAAALVEAAGIVEKAAIAQKAIPGCNISYIDGEEMQEALSGYLDVLYGLNPESVGGSVPGSEFYLMTGETK